MQGTAPSIAATGSKTSVVLASQISSRRLSLVSLPHCGSTVVGFAVVQGVASRLLVESVAEGFGTYLVRLLSLSEVQFRETVVGFRGCILS